MVLGENNKFYGSGIAAVLRGNNLVNCINFGSINGNSCGGVVVYSHDTPEDGSRKTSNILNVVNFGNINGKTYAGGILGRMNLEGSNIVSAYNLGSVNAGGIEAGIIWSVDSSTADYTLTVSDCYNINTQYFGTNIPTNVTVTNTGLINADGTFPNSTPYKDLLTALNAWVDANKSTYPELKNWVMGDNGYPTFAE